MAKMLQHFSDYMRAIKTFGDGFWLIDKIGFNREVDREDVVHQIKHCQEVLKNGKEARHYFFNDDGGDDFCFERTCLEAGLEPTEAKELVATLNSDNIENMYKKIQSQRYW